MEEHAECCPLPVTGAGEAGHTPILDEHARIQRVARRVGNGREECEDLTQDLWVELLLRPAKRRDGIVAWMQLLARHAIGRLRRRDLDRRYREQCAALPEALASTLDDLERRETRERVEHLVDELGEPYSTVLRLRFFEGLEIAEVAARTGRSPATVRSQIKRGLDRLRERRDSIPEPPV